jgi:hypothetical protein
MPGGSGKNSFHPHKTTCFLAGTIGKLGLSGVAVQPDTPLKNAI